MRKQAAKLAYGFNIDYHSLCQLKGIESLKTRREKYIDRFVMKSMSNTRFNDDWFPLRDQGQMEIRNRRNIAETRARTARYYNSPLAYMRRRANDLLTS